MLYGSKVAPSMTVTMRCYALVVVSSCVSVQCSWTEQRESSGLTVSTQCSPDLLGSRVWPPDNRALQHKRIREWRQFFTLADLGFFAKSGFSGSPLNIHFSLDNGFFLRIIL